MTRTSDREKLIAALLQIKSRFRQTRNVQAVRVGTLNCPLCQALTRGEDQPRCGSCVFPPEDRAPHQHHCVYSSIYQEACGYNFRQLPEEFLTKALAWCDDQIELLKKEIRENENG